MKRLLVTLFTIVCLTVPSMAYATPSSQPIGHLQTPAPSVATLTADNQPTSTSTTVQIRPIRGFSSHSFGSHSFGGSRSFGSRSFGSRSSSRSSRSSSGGSYAYRRYSSPFGGFHFGSMMTGFFLARLFNPFGFGYGYGGLGLFHIVFDIFLIWIIFKLFTRFMR